MTYYCLNKRIIPPLRRSNSEPKQLILPKIRPLALSTDPFFIHSADDRPGSSILEDEVFQSHHDLHLKLVILKSVSFRQLCQFDRRLKNSIHLFYCSIEGFLQDN